MRLVVVGYPTAEADTVRVCLDRWTLAGWGGRLTFVVRGVGSEMPGTCSHTPQVAVRFGSGDGCGSDGLTRSKNKVAVKAEKRWMTGSQPSKDRVWVFV